MLTVLYSHDGRGVGHVSRMAALAMGIKRLKPKERVICITGYDNFSSLHNNSEIEWIKLPSYRTVIEDGKVISKLSLAGYDKFQLAKIRADILLATLKTLKPDRFIVEYFPQGKMQELKKSLIYLKNKTKCKLFLGLRGVITDPADYGYSDIFSKNKFNFIDKIYDKIFCYTDPGVFSYSKDVLPSKVLDKVIYTGYVSRAFEIEHKLKSLSEKNLLNIKKYDKVIGFGCSVNALQIINQILQVKKNNFKNESWAVFLGKALPEKDKKLLKIKNKFLPKVDILEFNYDFLNVIKFSKVVISHGGYNTITDVMFYKKPAIFISRDVPERDQELHLECFKKSKVIDNYVKEKTFNSKEFVETLKKLPPIKYQKLAINGSEKFVKSIF